MTVLPMDQPAHWVVLGTVLAGTAAGAGQVSDLTGESVTNIVHELVVLWWRLASLLIVVGTFLGCWGYAVASWGWLLGIAFGWLPAAIIAVFAFFLWPWAVVLASAAFLLFGG